MSRSKPVDTLSIETDLLLTAIRSRYGYDFSQYSPMSLARRLEQARAEAGLARLTQLLDKVLHDPKAFDVFLRHMSITVTEMFRDPDFFAALREHVLPALKTYPFIKLWHAGCATGEEVYSMAILLHEERFLKRARLYGTDFNTHSLETAEAGVYDAARVEAYGENYAAMGGKTTLMHYFNVGYGRAICKDFLKERTTFSYHNLVADGVFGEMHMICCRNVLIYFNRALQDRVLLLFAESLRHGGFLCLGSKEMLHFTVVRDQFEQVEGTQRIYRKRGAAS